MATSDDDSGLSGQEAGWGSLAIAVAVPLAGGLIAGMASAKEILGWWQDVRKPRWTPPDMLFGNVWPVLYVLQGVASWFVWRSPDSQERSTALTLYTIQLVLNFMWNPLLFKTHLTDVALMNIFAILIFGVSATVYMNDAADMSSQVLPFMLPYLAFVLFAAALNFEVWRLNPSERLFYKRGRAIDTSPGKPKSGFKGLTKAAIETGKALAASRDAALKGAEAAAAAAEARKGLDDALTPLLGPPPPQPKKGLLDTVTDSASTAEKTADFVSKLAHKVDSGAQFVKRTFGKGDHSPNTTEHGGSSSGRIAVVDASDRV